MKKLLVLLLCLVMAVVASGCGKDEGKSAGNEPGGAQVQSEEKSGAEAEAEKEATEEKKEKEDATSAQATEIPLESAEELTEIVEEFNNTDDPEVKEELRQKLEEIFAQVEAASAEE
ncbi:MAG: hypothetical protein IJA16_00925 [Clostridia bacterium]|nr:hypothetical protein [Clostridia bacterium]